MRINYRIIYAESNIELRLLPAVFFRFIGSFFGGSLFRFAGFFFFPVGLRLGGAFFGFFLLSLLLGIMAHDWR